MFHSIKEFQEAWKHESANTAKLFNALNDQSLSQGVAEGHRNLGRIAWHRKSSSWKINLDSQGGRFVR